LLPVPLPPSGSGPTRPSCVLPLVEDMAAAALLGVDIGEEDDISGRWQTLTMVLGFPIITREDGNANGTETKTGMLECSSPGITCSDDRMELNG
jgi:hypothetical protein